MSDFVGRGGGNRRDPDLLISRSLTEGLRRKLSTFYHGVHEPHSNTFAREGKANIRQSIVW